MMIIYHNAVTINKQATVKCIQNDVWRLNVNMNTGVPKPQRVVIYSFFNVNQRDLYHFFLEFIQIFESF